MKRSFDAATFSWAGVEETEYAAQHEDAGGRTWRGTSRHIIKGREEGGAFDVRYFEVGPGGYTSLERHEHIHSVIGLRGRGYAIVGEEVHAIGPFDHVYVPPNSPHQFVNEGAEPFGFLCIVDADRDRPQALDHSELERLKKARATGGKIKP